MEALGRSPQRILCAPRPDRGRSTFPIDAVHRVSNIAAHRAVGLSSTHSSHLHAGWATIGGRARGMGSWSGTLPSKQAERPHFRTTVDIALPTMQAGQRDGPGIESHGPARLIQDRQSPHLPDNRWHCPSPPSRMGRGVRPTGPAEWYKIRLLPIHAVQPTGPVRRVRAAASAEAV